MHRAARHAAVGQQTCWRQQVLAAPRPPTCRRQCLLLAACTSDSGNATPEQQIASRRQAIQLGTALAAAAVLPGSADAAKVSSGFGTVKDTQDGYQFIYPYGWQEVSVAGQDVVYKDIIEPLESVSVTVEGTDKKDVGEYGSPVEVAATLTRTSLVPQSQPVKVLGVNERDADGRKYYEFEFASKAKTYIRHALASATVANGKFYVLQTGSNESRWSKMKDKLTSVVKSFEVVDRF